MSEEDAALPARARLIRAIKEMPDPVVDSQNPHFGNTYTSLQSVLEAARPVLDRWGLDIRYICSAQCVPGTVIVQNEGSYRHVEYEGAVQYLHTLIIDTVGNDGDVLGAVVERSTIIIGNTDDPQKLGSMLTYYKRYSLKGMFRMGEVDDDAEGAMNRSGSGKSASGDSSSRPSSASAGAAPSGEKWYKKEEWGDNIQKAAQAANSSFTKEHIQKYMSAHFSNAQGPVNTPQFMLKGDKAQLIKDIENGNVELWLRSNAGPQGGDEPRAAVTDDDIPF